MPNLNNAPRMSVDFRIRAALMRQTCAGDRDLLETLRAERAALLAALEWALPLARDAALLHPNAGRNPEVLRAIVAQIQAAETALQRARGE